MKIKLLLITAITLFCANQIFSQEDLLDELNAQVKEPPQQVQETFKSTRVINSHSVERMKQGQLDFRINHRFGQINDGAYNLWGLDNALVSWDFGYGITDWVMAGFRRSSQNKMYDGSLKFSIIRQTTGSKTIPVSVSYYTNLGIFTLKQNEDNFPFKHRLSYVHQILVARKFNEHISLQVMPIFVHRNLVNYDEDNNIYAVGVGGRYKFHRRVALTFEYFWCSQTASNSLYYNPLSVGVDIETGGHVFQLFLTNSRSMEESSFISQTMGSWLDGGIYFGFNISRVFAVATPKEK